jgi:predicted nucleic acid-binding protein
MKNFPYRIFLDTNVLLDDIFFRHYKKANSRSAHLAVDYLTRVARKETFVASFSIVQIISTLERARVVRDIVRQEIQQILTKHEIINFTEKDIQTALDTFDDLDIEDTFQFTVSQKVKCQYIITENIRDFRAFQNVRVIRPREIRRIIF